MYCIKCGKQLEDGSIYCNICGTKVPSEYIEDKILSEIFVEETNCAEIKETEEEPTKEVKDVIATEKEAMEYIVEEAKCPANKKKLPYIILIILAIIGIVVWGYFNREFGDYSNMTAEEAKSKIESMGLECSMVNKESDTVPQGMVIGTNIDSDKKLREILNCRIELFVSDGKYISLFDYEGMLADDVAAKLKELGAENVKIIEQPHDKIPVGEVVSIAVNDVRALAGRRISINDEIIIKKCNAVGAYIQDFNGNTEDYVREKLDLLNIPYKIEYQYNNEAAFEANNRKVLTQSKKTGWYAVNDINVLTLYVPKSSVEIKLLGFWHNYVNGVEVRMDIKNVSNKTIKYIYFEYVMKNAVGDALECDINGKDFPLLKVTGPIEANSTESVEWDAVFYSKEVAQFHLKHITVEYMDGTKQEIVANSYWH